VVEIGFIGIDIKYDYIAIDVLKDVCRKGKGMEEECAVKTSKRTKQQVQE
jgi:hypothetical protein